MMIENKRGRGPRRHLFGGRVLGDRKVNQILAELLNTTDSFAEIGRKHGITRQRVSQISQNAIKAGVDVPQRLKGRPARKKSWA